MQSTTDTQEQTRPATGSAEKVERIRDIIFGTQMRDYTQQFDGVNRALESMAAQSAQLLTQLQEQEERHQRALDRASEQHQARLQAQAEIHRQEVQRLQSQLAEQAASFHRQLTEQMQQIETQIQQVEERHATNFNALTDQLQKVEERLRSELESVSTALNASKTDRATLGELLVQLGTDLQATSALPLEIGHGSLDQLTDELL